MRFLEMNAVNANGMSFGWGGCDEDERRGKSGGWMNGCVVKREWR